MMYWLYVTGAFLAKILPLKVCYAVAGLVARLFFMFSEKDKEELRENLRVVLGEGADEASINEHIIRVFRNFAKYLADFFRFPVFTEERISKNIKMEGREHLDECLAGGKGALLLGLHLGNWELGGAIVGALKYPISAIVLEHGDRRINEFFVRQRIINRLRSIPVGVQVKECFKVLKRNEVLAVVGDKDYTSSGIYVDFFGKKALMPRGAAVLSLKTGAPIVFCALIREKDNTFKLCFEKPIRYTPTGDHGKDVRALMGEYLRIFEKYIRKDPDQWYAFRKIWVPEQTIQ